MHSVPEEARGVMRVSMFCMCVCVFLRVWRREEDGSAAEHGAEHSIHSRCRHKHKHTNQMLAPGLLSNCAGRFTYPPQVKEQGLPDVTPAQSNAPDPRLRPFEKQFPRVSCAQSFPLRKCGF